MIAVFFCIIFAAFSIGQASPCMKSFALGRTNAYKAFQIIDRQTDI